MGKIFEYYVQLILEILITSLIIACVIFFGIESREASIKRDNEIAVVHSLDEYRDLYMYDNKYISGDDVIRIMQYKKTMYDYWIDTDDSVIINYKADFTKPADVFILKDGTPTPFDTVLVDHLASIGYCKEYRSILRNTLGDGDNLNFWDITFLTEHFEIDRNGVYYATLIRDEYPDSVLTEEMANDNLDATRTVKGIHFERNTEFDNRKDNLR